MEESDVFKIKDDDDPESGGLGGHCPLARKKSALAIEKNWETIMYPDLNCG